MLQEFADGYVRQDKGGVTGVRTMTLTDRDMVRDSDASESGRILNGAQQPVPGAGSVTVNSGKATSSVADKNGTAQTGARARHERVTRKDFADIPSFLRDTHTRARVAKSGGDPARVQSVGRVDHHRTWADRSFTPTGVGVALPEPEPPVILLQGADRLIGSRADGMIRGVAGNDRLTARGGDRDPVTAANVGRGIVENGASADHLSAA